MKKYDCILSIVVTILAFPLSCLLKNMFPFDKLLSNNYVDVEYSDFYSAVGKSDSPSKDVAVIAVNGYSRRELALLIDTLSNVADVICLDLKFAKKKDNDSILISKIDNCKRIVLPYILEEDQDCYQKTVPSYFYNDLNSKSIIHCGAVNLNATKNGGIVRRFKPEFKLKEGGIIDNFAVAAVRCSADSNRVKRLESLSDNAIRLINYHDVRIPAYYVSDKPSDDSYKLLSNIEQLRGQIVLLGIDDENSDRHSVPVYGNLSGVLIHAYTIQTILSGQHIRENRGWIDYPLALLVTYLFCLFVCFVRRKYAYAEGLLVRTVQMGLIFLFVAMGVFLFLRSHIYVRFSFCLLMMSMSIFLLDIVSGLYGLTKNIRRK